MEMNLNNPILGRVNSAVRLPNTLDLFLEGRIVDYLELKKLLGDKLLIPKREICVGHTRRLALSILGHKAVVVPIVIVKTQDGYQVYEGVHRLAAVELLKGQHPDVKISIHAKLLNSNYGKQN